MLREQTFSDRSNYPKAVDAEWLAKIAEHKEKVGFTDLDDPNASKRKVQRTEEQMRELEGIEKAKAEARAQAEHQAALARLADGTAIHRQKKEGTALVMKGKAKSTKTKRDSSKDRPNAAARRAKIIKTINTGGRIKLERKKGAAYQAQYIDMRWIIDNHKMNIKRIKSVRSSDSYFVLDKFARYQAPEVINGAAEDKDKLLTALLSKKLVLASDVMGTNKLATATVLTIATQHDLEVYTVFDDKRVTHGWIYILDEEKRKAKIHKLGDMLQALDHLKEKKAKAGQ